MINNIDVPIIKTTHEIVPKKKSRNIEEPHAMNNSYICSNPGGSVSNLDCPEEDPLCNCPCRNADEGYVLYPSGYYIETVWELLLYDNEDLTQQVNEAIDPELPDPAEYAIVEMNDGVPSVNTEADGGGFYATLNAARQAHERIERVYDEPSRLTLTTLLKQSKECERIEEVLGADYLGCIWEDPNSPTSCTCPCIGDKFMEYLRYTRTNATFWNTPDYTPLYRNAQLALLDSQKIGIAVNGDLSVRPGDIVSLDIMGNEIDANGGDTSPEVGERQFKVNDLRVNAKFKGKWMVVSITHKMVGLKLHKMQLVLTRDSLPVDNVPEPPEPPGGGGGGGGGDGGGGGGDDGGG